MSATIAMRVASIASIVRRFSNFCTSLVAAVPATIAGASRSTKTPPTAVDDPEMFNTNAISATVATQSPKPETAWPASRFRKSALSTMSEWS
jgi:hypothetical protein